MTTRHKWSVDELNEVKHLFKNYFAQGKTPGEAAVQRAMTISKTKGGSIWKLPLKRIKSKVLYMRLHQN
jgi:hypothetical protein